MEPKQHSGLFNGILSLWVGVYPAKPATDRPTLRQFMTQSELLCLFNDRAITGIPRHEHALTFVCLRARSPDSGGACIAAFQEKERQRMLLFAYCVYCVWLCACGESFAGAAVPPSVCGSGTSCGAKDRSVPFKTRRCQTAACLCLRKTH